MDQETAIRLIEIYASFNELWDPKQKEYHNKNKREDIWDEIAKNIELPKTELKSKMKSLLSSYRRERNREKTTNVTGSGKNQLYTSKWFAYEAFKFLHDKNNPIETSDTMDSGSQADIGSNIGIMETNAEQNAINISETNQSSRPSDKFGKKNPAKRTFQEDSVTETEDQMLNDAIELLRKHNSTKDDPYVAFGMHVAAELRKYDNITFTQIKHSINNILYEADMTYLSQQTSARYHNENRPGYFTSHLADLSDSSASNNSGLTQLIHDLDT